MKKMQCNVLTDILERKIQSDDTQEEMSSVDKQTNKIVRIFVTELDRILDPFL